MKSRPTGFDLDSGSDLNSDRTVSNRAVITQVPDPNPAIPIPGFYRNYNSSSSLKLKGERN